MTYKPVQAVEVRAWGDRVGAVALDPKLEYYAFEYDPAFIRTGIELAPKAMPLGAASEPFIFPDLPELTFKRLPAMLADSLPDDFGNSLIDAWMSSQGIAAREVTPLDRLAYMGKRAMGALEFRPTRGPRTKPTAIDMQSLVEEARRAIRGQIDSDHLAQAALKQIIQVGTSAGGARAKAAVAWNRTTDELRAGQFETSSGFEHWILKFDGLGKDKELGSSAGYGRIEYAYYLMATAAGISMSESRLLEENGRAHFMTRRFDREGNEKHHLQSLCALAHLDYRQKATHDYNQFFQLMEELDLSPATMEEGYRRVAFNVMAKDCDDHTKNLSFLLRKGGTWQLSPGYDITHAHNPKGDWTYQHLMSVNGKFDGIKRDDLEVVADRFGIGSAAKVLRSVSDAIAAWPDFAKQAGVPDKDIKRIAAEHAIF
jgi:serine/threonine-protein kinase HipA